MHWEYTQDKDLAAAVGQNRDIVKLKLKTEAAVSSE